MSETDQSKPTNSPPEMRPEIYRTILAGQERFAYFFLTASGSAIAFAFLRTEGQAPACWMLPIGAAILCWGVSFYKGCEHLLSQRKVILANWQTLNIKGGTEPITQANPDLAESAMERLRKNAGADNEVSRRNGWQQYSLFLLGAAFYAIGHIQRLCS